MNDETDRTQEKLNKFAGQVRIKSGESLRANLRDLFSEQSVRHPRSNVRRLPSCGLLAAKHHTGGRRFRDQSVFLVGNGALEVADGLAPPHDRPFSSELCLPDWAKEIDFQFDRGERFLRRESACERDAHRRISYIAKNTAVQCSHGICMLWSGCQDHRRPPVGNVFRLKSNQTRNRHVVRSCSFPKVRGRGNFLCTHDLSAPAFDFRPPTLVSRSFSRGRTARSRGSSFFWRRLTIRLPSSVPAIKVANFAESTSARTSPRRCPSSVIDCIRSSQELRA